MKSEEILPEGYWCLIADDILQKVPISIPAIYEELKKLKIQTIVTTLMSVDSSYLPENVNVISLENPSRYGSIFRLEGRERALWALTISE